MEKKTENPRITEYKNARDSFVFREGTVPLNYQDEEDYEEEGDDEQ